MRTNSRISQKTRDNLYMMGLIDSKIGCYGGTFDVVFNVIRTISFAVTSCGIYCGVMGGIFNTIIQDKQYRELHREARQIADSDNNGRLSLEEKMRMYEEMGIPSKLEVEARNPSKSELENYIANKGGN